MKKLNEKVLIVYIMVLAYLIMSASVSDMWFVKMYNLIINPLCWIGMFLYCKFLIKTSTREKNVRKMTGSVFTITILYLSIQFTSGLITGYSKNPLSMEFFGIIKNLWSFIGIIFFQEYVRNVLVKSSNNNKWILFGIALLFGFVEINFGVFMNINSNAEMFKYVSRTILPVFTRSFLFTYIANITSYKPVLAYRVPTMLLTVLSPIMADYDWFMSGISEILIAVILYIYVSYFNSLSDRRISRRTAKKSNPKQYIPLIIFLLLVIGFVGGFFKYQPIAVMSNSMYPTFKRGDAVIIEKVDEDNLKKIEKGTIIEYILDGRIIIHRVDGVVTTKTGSTEYITKGDNNNSTDFKNVSPNQIVGIVRFYVPTIGYPSVWLSEIIK